MKLDFLKRFEFFTGVPYSLLKPLCDWLITEFGISGKHTIAANEGNAAAKDCDELSMIEVKCSNGARFDLGRPTYGKRKQDQFYGLSE